MSLEKKLNSLTYQIYGEIRSYFSGAFTWDDTPEGHSFWSNLDVEWQKVLESPVEEKGETVITIPLSDFVQIHSVACAEWKRRLTTLAELRMLSPTDDYVPLLESDIDQMFDAADSSQTVVLTKIFEGKLKYTSI